MKANDLQFDLEAYLSATAKQKELIAEALFKNQSPFVYRLAFNLCGNSAEAEDIVQEVFIAALKGLEKFRGESQLSTWLYRITTRIAGRHLARRPKTQTLDNEVSSIPGHEQADTEVANKELVKAIAKLTLPQRSVLSLVAIEGLSHQVAAEVLGVPEGTVWSRLHSARKRLAELLNV